MTHLKEEEGGIVYSIPLSGHWDKKKIFRNLVLNDGPICLFMIRLDGRLPGSPYEQLNEAYKFRRRSLEEKSDKMDLSSLA